MKRIAFSLAVTVPLAVTAAANGQELVGADLSVTQAQDLGLFYEYLQSGGNVRRLREEAAFRRARLRERSDHRAGRYRANYSANYRADYRAPYMTRRR